MGLTTAVTEQGRTVTRQHLGHNLHTQTPLQPYVSLKGFRCVGGWGDLKIINGNLMIGLHLEAN